MSELPQTSYNFASDLQEFRCTNSSTYIWGTMLDGKNHRGTSIRTALDCPKFCVLFSSLSNSYFLVPEFMYTSPYSWILSQFFSKSETCNFSKFCESSGITHITYIYVETRLIHVASILLLWPAYALGMWRDLITSQCVQITTLVFYLKQRWPIMDDCMGHRTRSLRTFEPRSLTH